MNCARPNRDGSTVLRIRHTGIDVGNAGSPRNHSDSVALDAMGVNLHTVRLRMGAMLHRRVSLRYSSDEKDERAKCYERFYMIPDRASCVNADR
jgi:hypothetical protein